MKFSAVDSFFKNKSKKFNQDSSSLSFKGSSVTAFTLSTS